MFVSLSRGQPLQVEEFRTSASLSPNGNLITAALSAWNVETGSPEADPGLIFCVLVTRVAALTRDGAVS